MSGFTLESQKTEIPLFASFVLWQSRLRVEILDDVVRRKVFTCWKRGYFGCISGECKHGVIRVASACTSRLPSQPVAPVTNIFVIVSSSNSKATLNAPEKCVAADVRGVIPGCRSDYCGHSAKTLSHKIQVDLGISAAAISSNPTDHRRNNGSPSKIDISSPQSKIHQE